MKKEQTGEPFFRKVKGKRLSPGRNKQGELVKEPSLLPVCTLYVHTVCVPVRMCTPGQELDTRDPLHVDFWSALAVVAEHELVESAKQEEVDRAR